MTLFGAGLLFHTAFAHRKKAVSRSWPVRRAKVHIEQANSFGYIMDSLLNAPTVPAYIRHSLYLQALFETDRAKLSARIREAETALVRREHELYTIGQSTAEREAVVTALNALYALRTCLGFESTAAAALTSTSSHLNLCYEHRKYYDRLSSAEQNTAPAV